MSKGSLDCAVTDVVPSIPKLIALTRCPAPSRILRNVPLIQWGGRYLAEHDTVPNQGGTRTNELPNHFWQYAFVLSIANAGPCPYDITSSPPKRIRVYTADIGICFCRLKNDFTSSSEVRSKICTIDPLGSTDLSGSWKIRNCSLSRHRTTFWRSRMR